MRVFLETWTLRKVTHAGNHKTVPITRGHYMAETDLLASPTRAAEWPRFVGRLCQTPTN